MEISPGQCRAARASIQQTFGQNGIEFFDDEGLRLKRK
jgi:hypothetical protein